MEGSQTIKIYSEDCVKKCLMCKNEPVNISFLPCKHESLCSGCVLQKGKLFTYCPVCGRYIEGTFRNQKDNGVILVQHVSDVKCIICEEASATLKFRPCNHQLLCVGCYATRQFAMLFCIKCRKPIVKADNSDSTTDPQEKAFFSNENCSFHVSVF